MADKIFVVDDQKSIRMLIEAMLSDRYDIETFQSAETCLSRIEQEIPSLFLLDVELPGIDGYELCRRIRAMPACAAVPVVFISACTTLEDVLTGYDAGADDYVIKPFEQIGLHRKVDNLLRIVHEKRCLQQQAHDTEELVSLLQTSLDDNALLIRFLRSLAECDGVRSVVAAVQRYMATTGLIGAVQVRMRNKVSTYSETGENSPMAIAVIDHVRKLDRIFEFKRCCVINFPHVSLLVTNMPLVDTERCGRIRDDYAIAAESADARLAAIQSSEDKARIREEIIELIQDLGKTVAHYGNCHKEANQKGILHTTQLIDSLLATMAHLGLSSQQEEEIIDMVRNQSSALVRIYDFARGTNTDFARLMQRLEGVLAVTGPVAQH